MKQNRAKEGGKIPWTEFDTVLFDMDGTLLDKYFDDYFWEEYVVVKYAEKNNLVSERAKKELLDRYRSVENTLAWTDLDHWQRELELNLPRMKEETAHLINILPHAEEFLLFVKMKKKKIHLVTNAPPFSLNLKLKKTGIREYFDDIVCSADIGEAKEQSTFWPLLQKRLDFSPAATILFDDTEKVLDTAKKFGIRQVVHIAGGNSKKTPEFSSSHLSITSFLHLLQEKDL